MKRSSMQGPQVRSSRYSGMALVMPCIRDADRPSAVVIRRERD